MEKNLKPNIKMLRIDERLIHGQGQLWIKNLGVNLVICANDSVAESVFEQTLMKTSISENVGVRFWTVAKTAETVWKAAPQQTIFVVVKSTDDARKLAEAGFPIDEINVGNIHPAEGKEKVSQFIYLSEIDKENLKVLRDQYGAKFNTKTSPVSNDGEKSIEDLMKALR